MLRGLWRLPRRAHKKRPPEKRTAFLNSIAVILTLTGLKTALRFIDHVHAAFAAHDAAIAVPVLQRAK